MRNILIITRREFITQVKKKYFIIITLLAPILIVLFGMIIGFMFKANHTEYHLQIVDNSQVFKQDLKSNENIKYSFIDPSTEQKAVNSLKDEDSEFDGVLIIPSIQNNDFDALEKNIKLLTNKKTNFDTKQNIASDISDVVRKQKIIQLGLSENQIKDLDKGFDLNTVNINDANDNESGISFGVKSALGFIMMYVIFMFIVIYGVRIMRSVLEEKNNRIVEIILSSVKPYELMVGKIVGTTLVGLTQFIVWIGMTITLTLVFGTSSKPTPTNLDLNPNDITMILSEVSNTLLDLNVFLIIFCFIIFFMLGYIFYSSMYAAIGSAVDNETETQQFTLFAILPLSLGLYGAIGIIQNPEGPMAFWLSMIPLTSPVAMVARIPFGVPLWEIITSIVVLAISTVLMILLAAKIYRIGVLTYGNKTSFKQIWKWIRQ